MIVPQLISSSTRQRSAIFMSETARRCLEQQAMWDLVKNTGCSWDEVFKVTVTLIGIV